MAEDSTDNKTDRIKLIAEGILLENKELKFGELKGLAEELKSAGENLLAEQINKRADDIKEADEKRAENILGSPGSTPDEMLSLAKRLAGYKQFGYARRLLDQASKPNNEKTPLPRQVLKSSRKGRCTRIKTPTFRSSGALVALGKI